MKDKGVIISIGLILIIGVLVTGGTRHFVSDGKSQTAKGEDVYGSSLYSDARTGAENAPGWDTAKASLSSTLVSGASEEKREMAMPMEEIEEEANAGAAPESDAVSADNPMEKDEAAASGDGSDTMTGYGSPEALTAPEPEVQSAPLGAPASVMSDDTEEGMDGGVQPDAASAEGKASQKSSMEPAASTVISPLTGVVEYKETTGTVLTQADYQKRFQEVDSRIQKVKESGVVPNTDTFKNMAEYEYRLWDNELNTIYKDILKGMTEEETEALKKEEREWMKTRDETARKAASKYSGGSIESMEYTASLADSTRSRAYKLLEDYGSHLPTPPSTEDGGAH